MQQIPFFFLLSSIMLFFDTSRRNIVFFWSLNYLGECRKVSKSKFYANDFPIVMCTDDFSSVSSFSWSSSSLLRRRREKPSNNLFSCLRFRNMSCLSLVVTSLYLSLLNSFFLSKMCPVVRSLLTQRIFCAHKSLDFVVLTLQIETDMGKVFLKNRAAIFSSSPPSLLFAFRLSILASVFYCLYFRKCRCGDWKSVNKFSFVINNV